MTEFTDTTLITLTADIVGAHVSNNAVATSDLPQLIQSVHAALQAAAVGAPVEAEVVERPVPAVSVRKSTASPEFILSLIDGKPYKSLKRHLTGQGYTPESYRAAFGLSDTYPMVAPAYSEHRRQVAVKLGLGRKPKAAVVEPKAAAAPKGRTLKLKTAS